MTSLVRGQNTSLPAGQATVLVTGISPGTVDLMVFQVTGAGKVRGDADFVFYNQPSSPEGAVRLTGPASISVDVARLPPAIEMLRIAVSLDEGTPGSLAAVSGLGVTIGSISAPAIGLTTERAAVLAEIYRRGSQWKVRNISAGWERGLAALATEHGVVVDDAPPPRAPARPTPPPSPAPRVAPAPAPPVDMRKVTLTKASPTLSLVKAADRPTGVMRVNLDWSRGRRGFFGGRGIDLDLACLYQLRNGDKGVVQALGRTFGELQRPPYIRLDRDDRTGAVAGGENLHINLARLAEFKRILIFAYIYEGSPNWAAANGVVTLYPPGRPEVEVRLDSPDNRAVSCAVALLKNDRGELTVSREVRYIHGTQEDVSKAYRWGLRWTPGRK